MLSIRLVGGVAVHVDDRTIDAPSSRRAWALLAWLALHPGLHSRADVAARLWPDVVDSSARQSMRSALWSLRQALDEAGADVLLTTRDRVGLAADVDVDACRFGAHLAAGRLAEAVSVGDGDLLAGVDDEWALVARDTHRERLVSALGELSRQSADPAQAVQLARRACALDPLSEEAARALMERLAACGDRPAALAAYQRLAERLRRELRVPPSEPTWRLAEQIRTSGDVAPVPALKQQRVHSAPNHQRLHAAVTQQRPHSGALPLVGRGDELAELRQAWTATTEGSAGSGAPGGSIGSGGLAVVHGDPGIGKTRLVNELSEIARRDGAMLATGAPPDLAGEALTAWVEVCGSLVGQLGALPDAPWVDVLAPLVPSLVPAGAHTAAHEAARGAQNGARTGAPPDLEQARLGESIVALLETCTRSAPVLLVLEDLHAADDATLAVLSHVARRVSDRRVLIVATHRERPVRDRLATLEQSHRQRGTLRADVGLGPLDGPAVARLARAAGRLSEDAVGQVVQVADGNALLAVEVARALAAGDALPLGLRGSTRAAAARLPADARALVRTLAVAGRDLDSAEAAERAQVDLATALPPAEDQGLLVSRGQRLGFRHALLRESIYADMPGQERAQLHTRAADLLRAEGSHARAAEAAAHLRAVGRLAEAGQHLVQAAAHARALGALADATTLLREATSALPDDPAPALELADVLAWRGCPADAQAAFDVALSLLEVVGNPEAIADAHLRFAEWHYGPICQPSVSVAACRRALAVLDGAALPADDLRARVLSVNAWCEAVVGSAEDIERALAMLTALVGDEPSDPAIAAGLDRTRSFALLRQGRFIDAVAPAIRGAEASSRIGRPDLTYTALVNAAFGQAASGHMDAALELLDQSAAALAGYGMLAIETLVLVYRAWVLAQLGRLAEAAQAAAQARRVADRLDAPALQAIVDAERGRVAMRAGEFDAAAQLLAAALAVPDASIGRPLARLQRAESLARGNRLDEAEGELAEVVFEPVRDGDWPETLVIRMAAVEGLVAAGRGNYELARARLSEAVDGWRRLTPVDLAERIAAVMADLGRPIIGLILPVEELAAVEVDLAALGAVTQV